LAEAIFRQRRKTGWTSSAWKELKRKTSSVRYHKQYACVAKNEKIATGS